MRYIQFENGLHLLGSEGVEISNPVLGKLRDVSTKASRAMPSSIPPPLGADDLHHSEKYLFDRTARESFQPNRTERSRERCRRR